MLSKEYLKTLKELVEGKYRLPPDIHDMVMSELSKELKRIQNFKKSSIREFEYFKNSNWNSNGLFG